MSAYKIRVDIKLQTGGGGGAFTCWWKRLCPTLALLSGDASEEIHKDSSNMPPDPKSELTVTTVWLCVFSLHLTTKKKQKQNYKTMLDYKTGIAFTKQILFLVSDCRQRVAQGLELCKSY